MPNQRLLPVLPKVIHLGHENDGMVPLAQVVDEFAERRLGCKVVFVASDEEFGEGCGEGLEACDAFFAVEHGQEPQDWAKGVGGLEEEGCEQSP